MILSSQNEFSMYAARTSPNRTQRKHSSCRRSESTHNVLDGVVDHALYLKMGLYKNGKFQLINIESQYITGVSMSNYFPMNNIHDR